MIFTKTLQKMLKIYMILQAVNFIHHYPKKKKKKLIGLMKYELGGKILTKFVGLGSKNHSNLIDDGSEDKKAKGTKYVL